MKWVIKILSVIAVLIVIVAGLVFIRNKECSVPLHDMDIFISNDQVSFIVDIDSSNLRELLREFDYTYFQKISNPSGSKMFYIVSVIKEKVQITRYERDFDQKIYTFYIEPADEYYFITDMDADIKAELVSHNSFNSIEAFALMARNLRTYNEVDDGIVMNPSKIVINFELYEKHAEFTIGVFPNIEMNQYSVKIVNEKNK